MSIDVTSEGKTTAIRKSGWRELLASEDWWAVWIGLFLVFLGIVLWKAGSSISVITAQIPKWTTIETLGTSLSSRSGSIVLLFLSFLVLFSITAHFLHLSIGKFIASFTILFVVSVLINLFSTWGWAQQYNLESPIVALIIGLVAGNLIPIADWFSTALRTELYVKVGIVLLGATLPFTLIIQAGPVAFLQASLIAISTFLVIYFVGTRWFGLDPHFASVLGVGGSVCGVSAAIAVGGAIKAKKEHVSISISLVVIWAVFSIFLLTFLIKLLGIPAGAAGAWIGTSEFADAAGITAASAFGEHALTSFTLLKVIGRDIFIGVWSFILAFISITYWENKQAGTKANPSEIWHRFPKFIIGFLIASILLTVVIAVSALPTHDAITANIIAPIKELRTWAFTFTFLSIGLTTRFKSLTAFGWRPLAAFSTGAVFNIVLGYILSVLLLHNYWAGL